jgi:hypothetical protein
MGTDSQWLPVSGKQAPLMTYDVSAPAAACIVGILQLDAVDRPTAADIELDCWAWLRRALPAQIRESRSPRRARPAP